MADQIQHIAITSLTGQEWWLLVRPSGLCRSSDAGATWQQLLSSEEVGAELSQLAVSPNFSHDQTLVVGGQSGIWISQNAGQSWQASELEQPIPAITGFAISPDFGRDQTLFAATQADGVLVSHSAGRRWAKWNIGLFDHRVGSLALSADFAQDRTLYAGTRSGLFCSTNAARSWHELATPWGESPITVVHTTNHYQAPALLIGGEGAGILLSLDGGKSWQKLGAQALSGKVKAIMSANEGYGLERLLVLADGQLWLSEDLGASWEAWSGEHEPIMAIARPEGFGNQQTLVAADQTGKIRLLGYNP
jgi:photosystem II stability/assembly factor-like uncharacterized protein